MNLALAVNLTAATTTVELVLFAFTPVSGHSRKVNDPCKDGSMHIICMVVRCFKWLRCSSAYDGCQMLGLGRFRMAFVSTVTLRMILGLCVFDGEEDPSHIPWNLF